MTIEADYKKLEDMMFDGEKQMRHWQAAHASDFQFLRDSLRSAAQRFSDVADLLEKKEGYDAVSFLRASAERYLRIAERA